MARNEVDSRRYSEQKDTKFNLDEHVPGRSQVIDTDPVINQDWLDTEAFMNEMVTVVLHETGSPLDKAVETIGINGRNQNFIRGQPNTVRRCYVDRLARMRQTHYSQNLDPSQGESEYNAMNGHTSLLIPFSVMEDKNPKGAAWLKALLAEKIY